MGLAYRNVLILGLLGCQLPPLPAGDFERHFDIDSTQVTWPMYNGWAKTESASDEELSGEYRLGRALTKSEKIHLALPMVKVGSQVFMTDPMFSTLFVIRKGTLTIRYQGAVEPRRVAVVKASTFDQALEKFFATMLPDVSPGPAWLHEIAWVHYDYLSDDAKGWENDAQAMARWLKPDERKKVAMCYLSWYDVMGSYCFRDGKMMDEWVAWPRTAKFKYTQAELKRRLKAVRDLGFRVLLYFGDGMACDDAGPTYRDELMIRSAEGKKIEGWFGKDTLGKNYFMDPTQPPVYSWFLKYMDALLAAYGRDVDGFVWDETYHMRVGMKGKNGHADRAMLSLTRDLAKKVRAFDRDKVFLTSDLCGILGNDVPACGMMAHGVFQDSSCHPVAWSYGLFPNYRNTLWSCNWQPVTRFPWTRWGVENFGAPVSSTNGSEDDRGPSEWTPTERDRFLALFRAKPRAVKYLLEDPSTLLLTAPHRPQRGDRVPEDGVNFAREATVEPKEAASVIDGDRRSGWDGAPGESIQIDFGRRRAIDRLAVTTSDVMTGIETYRIDGWDGRAWKTLVTETRRRALKTRVHALARPQSLYKIRITIDSVAPLNGRAKIMELEAAGPEDY